MKQWQKKDLKFLNNSTYFPNCIECSDHYLDSKHRNYFHKGDCQCGQKDWETTNARLNERLEAFEKRHGVDGCGVQCKKCKNIAVGEMHVLYHYTKTTIERWPVCTDHSFHEDSAGRETQFKGF